MNESQQTPLRFIGHIGPIHPLQLAGSESARAKPKRVYHRMGVPYLERSGLWAIRARRSGQTIHLRGFPNSNDARRALVIRLRDAESGGEHFGRMSVAEAMQRHALRHLPGLRSARSEARSINPYLRAAGLCTLQVEDSPTNSGFWTKADVRLQERVNATDTFVQSGRADKEEARSARLRAQLARTRMSAVSKWQVHELLDALESEGRARGTVLKERAVLGRLFNYACNLRGWPSFAQNPMTGLRLQGSARRRQRVMTELERQRLAAAFRLSGDLGSELLFTFLAETGVRARDCVEQASWGEVFWAHRLLRPSYARLGSPFIPLSDCAIDVLKAMPPASDPSQKIFGVDYKSFKAAWKRACKVAGVDDLRIQDLRLSAQVAWLRQPESAFVKGSEA